MAQIVKGDSIVSELHGRFYWQNVNQNVYAFGLANTALTSLNAIATGLTATATPVIGVYNPPNSGVNLEILQCTIIHTTLSNSAVNTGGFDWVVSLPNQSAISTGSTPWNCATLTQAGSVAKAFAMTTAITGLTGSLVDTGLPVDVGNFTAAGAATAVSLFTSSNTHNVDGGLLVVPGMFVGVMNLLSTTTVKVSAGLKWAEYPIPAGLV
jgi:hypothetical protein